MSQPQLLKIALDPQDIVFTPDWVAQDMVSFFQPSGVILDPCKGKGVFQKYLPASEWCEISEGKDFYAWEQKVDWCFGNPPYRQMLKWIRHSMKIANNICYLIPLDKPFISMAFVYLMEEWGKIKHMRAYGTGTQLGFPIGFAVGALHFEKGYAGPMYQSIAAMPSNTACTRLGEGSRQSSLFPTDGNSANSDDRKPAPSG